MNAQKPTRLAPKKPSNPSLDSLTGKDDRWLLIGAVGKPHGLRGAFFVSGRSDPLPKGCKQAVVGDSTSTGTVHPIATASLLQDRPVMAFADVPDRTAIELLRGSKVWIPRDSVPVDDSAEYLWSDFLGSEVFDAAGLCLGRIVDMTNYGASDIAVIENSQGARLDMAFVDVYVDMSFRGTDKRINLLVESSVFAEFWVKP